MHKNERVHSRVLRPACRCLSSNNGAVPGPPMCQCCQSLMHHSKSDRLAKWSAEGALAPDSLAAKEACQLSKAYSGLSCLSAGGSEETMKLAGAQSQSSCYCCQHSLGQQHCVTKDGRITQLATICTTRSRHFCPSITHVPLHVQFMLADGWANSQRGGHVCEA